MNVTKLNFKYLYPQIYRNLTESNFISIDFEFSGTSMHKCLTNTRFDDENLRYFKLKENIKNFIPLQVGLCGIKTNLPNDPTEKFKINLLPMNFFIFPFLPDNSDKKLIFDVGSINFLTSNSFDFNKTFYDGIRYISLHELEKAKQNAEINKILKSKKEQKFFPPEARLLTMTFYPQLKNFVDNFYNKKLNFDDPENFIEFEISSVRKVLVDYFVSNLNSLFKIKEKNVLFEVEFDNANISKNLIKLKITNEENLIQKSISLFNSKNFKKISSFFYYQSLQLNNNSENQNLLCKILINLLFYIKPENDLEQIHKNSLNDLICKIKETLIEKSQNNENSPSQEEIEKLNLISSIDNLENFVSSINKNYNSQILKMIYSSILSFDQLDSKFKIGFSQIIKDLINLKKPLLFHNGILDLMHLVDKFIEPIPENLDQFKEIVNKNFPTIYDTKYLIENNSSLFSLFPDSSLESVANKIILEKLIPENINLEIGEENEISESNQEENNSNTNSNLNTSEYNFDVSNIESSKAHEAGYDAMMTSYVFLFIFHNLFKNLKMITNKNHVDTCLLVFKNKLLLSGLQFALDLNPKTNLTSEKRFQIFVISNLPEIVSGEEIKNNFKLNFGVNPQIYKLFGQNIAYVHFTSSSQQETFLEVVEKSLVNSGIGYDKENFVAEFRLQGYLSPLIITTYNKYLECLKISLVENKLE